MRRIYIGLIISCFCACSAFSQDYFPLREGNQWAYVMSNGVEMVVRVSGFTEINGVRCAIVDSLTRSADSITASREYLSVDTEGLKVHLSKTQDQEVVYDPPLVRIKLPFVQNQIWTSTIEQENMDLITAFESTGTQLIPTNIGSFQCIVVRSRANIPGQQAIMSTSYYSEGVGLIRQEMEIGDQEIIVSLVSANVEPTEKIEAPPKPVISGDLKCPHCGAAIVDASAKFCSRCGKEIKIETSTIESEPVAVDPNEESILELYESTQLNLMLYKPKNWNVVPLQFDNGVNITSIVRPDESALVVFMTFPILEEVTDSVSLAATCINLFKNNIPDLEGTNVQSSPNKDLTVMDISFTEGQTTGIGHGYFFCSDQIDTAYFLLARDDTWKKIQPTLMNIASNIAYSTKDIEIVMNQGADLAAKSIYVDPNRIINPASFIQKISKNAIKEIQLVPSGLADNSITLDIPKDWYLEGNVLQFSPTEKEIKFTLTDDEILKNCGVLSKSQTVVPSNVITPGVINITYQNPEQILSLVLNFEDIGNDFEVLGEIPAEQVSPEIASSVKEMNMNRYQVDNRLIYAKFQNIVTEKTLVGLFSVQCISKPMNSAWQFTIDGYWAQEDEFEEWLPLFLKVSETIKVNQNSDSDEKQKRFQALQKLNRNLQNVIADSNQIFEEYVDISQNDKPNRDYLNWILGQTTLGYGVWAAQNEGAQVTPANAWGIEDTSENSGTSQYNTTKFSNVRLWTPDKLGLINAQEEFNLQFNK